MDRDQLNLALEARRACVVHFSHHANMRDGGTFPSDLLDAIANRASWPLSCCVLWPGHQMDLPGSVGVIFAPTPDNVISVCSDDAGSFFQPDGTDASAGRPLTAESFEETFNPRINSYNEWRVIGAAVVGIFVSDPQSIHVKQRFPPRPPHLPDEVISSAPVPLEYIFQSFPSLELYTLSSQGLVPIQRNQS